MRENFKTLPVRWILKFLGNKRTTLLRSTYQFMSAIRSEPVKEKPTSLASAQTEEIRNFLHNLTKCGVFVILQIQFRSVELPRKMFFVPQVSAQREAIFISEARQLTLKVCCLLEQSQTDASALALEALSVTVRNHLHLHWRLAILKKSHLQLF